MAQPSPTPYLLTGVTGGLGTRILHDLIHTHSIPPSSIIATSRSEDARQTYESQGLQFRIADYNDPSTLATAFDNIETLLFVSSSTRDTAIRNIEHANVIKAAKKCGVKRVWYISLAFGGYTDNSKIGFQQAHYETEHLLRASGLDFVSLRAGVYTDAFPLFLNWYPATREVFFPKLEGQGVDEGLVAFTSRDELGEGIATLLAKGLGGIEVHGESRIVLLTSQKTFSLVDLVDGIRNATGKELAVKYLEPEEWITACSENDLGGKGRAWFGDRLFFMQGVAEGDAASTSDVLTTLLGREPEGGVEGVERLVRESGGEYYWHQNHVGAMPKKENAVDGKN